MGSHNTGTGGLTYRDAGVDIDAADHLVASFRSLAAGTARPGVLAGVGGFAGLFKPPGGGGPIIVAATDGIGTKLLLARQADTLAAAGQDLVAMSVNDILVYGAEPWFFLDYLAMGRLNQREALAMVAGIADACKIAGCALLGGETAELPGMLRADDLELAGFAVGGVAPTDLVDGRRVAPGHILVGLAASGLHSNGFSLARQVLLKQQGWDLATIVDGFSKSLGDLLLQPTRIYAAAVAAACQRFDIGAMAHITGGGLTGNVARTLPPGVRARLRPGSWPEPDIFALLRRAGPLAETEMRQTFNLGIGYTMVVPAAQADDLCATIGPMVGGAWPIGVIEQAPAGAVPVVIWS